MPDYKSVVVSTTDKKKNKKKNKENYLSDNLAYAVAFPRDKTLDNG